MILVEENSKEDAISKNLFAEFGRAYFLSDCLHRELLHCYILHMRINSSEHFDQKYQFAEKHFTLGMLVNKLEPNLDDDLFKELEGAVEQRNFLAHRFWYRKSHLLGKTENVIKLTEELQKLSHLFENLDEKIRKITKVKFKKLGVTEESTKDAYNQILNGVDLNQHSTQRMPNKAENIINVWEIDFSDNRKSIVFESDDHVCWEIHDDGLGWTRHQNVEDNWKKVDRIQKYLPARINIRPKIDKPWHFKLNFPKKMIFEVKMGEGKIFWSFREK